MRYILSQLERDETAMKIIKDAMQETGHKSPETLLKDLAGQEPSLLLILDEIPAGLPETIAQIAEEIECITFQTFTCGTEHIHQYNTLFSTWDFDYDPGTEPDSIIIPMGKKDFTRIFLKERCWHGVRLSQARLGAIKYVAAYQTTPISAVTHYARVERIEPLDKTGKYSLYFKYQPVSIEPLRYQLWEKKHLLRSPRYSYLERILSAEFIEDLF